MKRIIAVLASVGLFNGVIATEASASDVPTYKVCYFDNPTEIKMTLNNSLLGGISFVRSALQDAGPQNSVPADIPLDVAKFSGDCPSNMQPSQSSDALYMYRDTEQNQTYYEDGATKYYTPLQRVLGNNGIMSSNPIRWIYEDESSVGDSGLTASLTYVSKGFNSQTGQREVEPRLVFNSFGVSSFLLAQNRWITYKPTSTEPMEVWTGNLATENFPYSADVHPGGYVMGTYVIIPKNPMSFKWKTLNTSVVAKASKKRGSYFTATVNIDRLYTDANGKDVKRYPGDVVTIKRGSKVVGTAKVNKNGVAKLRIKDITGANTYTVTVPETNRNWDGLATFVK